MRTKKKNLDNEINLISFISLLSVLICTLLLSTVWVKISTFDISQAVGGAQTKLGKKQNKNPRLLVTMNKRFIQVRVKNSRNLRSSLRVKKFFIKNGVWSQDFITKHVKKIVKKLPKLQQAFVKPSSASVYKNVIAVMDSLKIAGITQLGIVPL